ncbi:MAG: isocitrate/isopropylmalate family dehydrogenase, partial [Nitrosopumilaceae archaeon]
MYKISLITGDGIGPEISESVIKVLETINDKLGLKINIEKLEAGDKALAKTGKALPDSTLNAV